jgi:5-methylthioadenosine/S-adenosylhomocysteine deaminase
VQQPRPILVRGGVVLPMWPHRRVVHHPGSVLIDGPQILAVGSVEELDAHPLAATAEVVDATGHAVIPGLHNCHLHSGLLRGTAEGLPLFEWLTTFVDPAHKALTPEIAKAASELCYAEALLSGTTSVMDMWRFQHGSAEVAGRLGIRSTLVPYVADAEGYDYFESLDSNRALLADHRSSYDGRVRTWVGLEHLLYCTEKAFAGAVALAREYDTGIHTHSSETGWEVEESLRLFGHRPIHEFARRGLLEDGRCVIAHCVWLDDAEIAVLAETDTGVAHCPCSNMKLASGAAPIPALWRAGVHVGLGSDGEKENNNLDLLEEMKFASLLQKLVGLDATAGDPYDILAMATVEGARCLGLGHVTGALRPGLRADVVTVDLNQLHTTPVVGQGDSAPDFPESNVAAHLVFSARGPDVSNVWIDGAAVVAGGRLLTGDVARIRENGQVAAEELFTRRAQLRDAPPLPRTIASA